MNESCRALAPWAVADEAAGHRRHVEDDPVMDGPFRFDRERIIRSAAFRRLQYKTQVFATQHGDHFRTRLTHTLEVVAIARQLARLLQVNEELAEAIALAHDLGHPPFGHAGEAALHHQLQDHGGFEHNRHALRVVEYLEHPVPRFRGLNLTREVREALLKHRTRFDQPMNGRIEDPELAAWCELGPLPSIEGQVVALADRVAYDLHDLEDALAAAFIQETDLQTLQLWQVAADQVRQRYPEATIFAIRRPVLERLQNLLLADAAQASRQRLEQMKEWSAGKLRQGTAPLVTFSSEWQQQISVWEELLAHKVYSHPRVRRIDQAGQRVISSLFEIYLQEPTLMPERFRERISSQGPHLVIADYLAGMTDRYCEHEFQKYFLPFNVQ
ncbi:MAG: Deoxyguanosinetriphosphate triphosphohydrolase-like protein [Phycisphaerae bacterium]|nr:Deoxyguanosinetriphosphate triphosphohydrolase-like protein [Phycisphaerae bacterium]